MKTIRQALGKPRHRIVGLMSGTSADGVDAAVLEVETLAAGALSWELLDFQTYPYDEAVREEILAVQRGETRLLERLTRLHFVLGHLFADAVERVSRDAGTELSSIDAVASHGQTVCHLPRFPRTDLVAREAKTAAWGRLDPAQEGWVSASTLQIGEPGVIAERTGVPVVSNFRSRDVAAGGTGAPLVPLVDYQLFSSPDRARMALNVGGIANLTALPAGGVARDCVGFDTGPGNMVIDGVMEILTRGKKHVDEGGGLARKGKPRLEVVEELLRDPFFRKSPPKAAGREQFGQVYARGLVDRCEKEKLTQASTLATATRLTAAAVHDAYRRFVEPGFSVQEVIVSGGGAHNVALLESLGELFPGVSVVTSDYYGLDVDAKEAVAFALLAHLTLRGEPGSLPHVTGAAHPVILGDLTPGDRPA